MMLTDVLAAQVGVLCIQEFFAGDFPSRPVDHTFTYDGLVGSFGREAAFLIRAGFQGVPISGVEDRTCARWHAFSGSWYIYSYYVPHAGIPQDERVRFWRDFVVNLGLPMIIAGDANVWMPHFNLSRSRSCDKAIIPLWIS